MIRVCSESSRGSNHQQGQKNHEMNNNLRKTRKGTAHGNGYWLAGRFAQGSWTKTARKWEIGSCLEPCFQGKHPLLHFFIRTYQGIRYLKINGHCHASHMEEFVMSMRKSTGNRTSSKTYGLAVSAW